VRRNVYRVACLRTVRLSRRDIARLHRYDRSSTCSALRSAPLSFFFHSFFFLLLFPARVRAASILLICMRNIARGSGVYGFSHRPLQFAYSSRFCRHRVASECEIRQQRNRLGRLSLFLSLYRTHTDFLILWLITLEEDNNYHPYAAIACPLPPLPPPPRPEPHNHAHNLLAH
jgi:hypothetical protein